MKTKDLHPRAHFMSQADKDAMGKQPRTHQNCMDATGKARPGKTAHDRARKEGRL